jgi:stringent starvation protein B
MLSNKPYLLRAFHEWIVDSACTPILVLDANNPRCEVPQEYIEGGEIVFNISTTAIRDLNINNKTVEFKASFSGTVHIISAPIKAVLALYAEENNEGVFFDAEEDDSDSDGDGERPMILQSIEGSLQTNVVSQEISGEAKAKPFLRLVE